ncbi:MAG: acetate uptake transporter [Actinomycetota bacterium]|nr:acetate uptake transporter [Actinomycetota bacterium]
MTDFSQTSRDAGTKPEPALPSAVADPAPLGLAAFAMTTFVLSVFNANIISDAKLEAVVLPLALFYGGLTQLLAGMWEFRNRNTFGAAAFSSFGAFWLAYAAYVKFVVPGLAHSTDAYKATGLFLLSWAIFTGYMLIASLRVSVAVAAVFLTLFVTFVLLSVGTLNSNTSIVHAGGWVGLATAVVAWYASFAGVMNSTWKKTIMPVGART